MLIQKLPLLPFLLVCQACWPSLRYGKLLVAAPQAGVFEIFRIVSANPLHFIAEQTASFGQPTPLTPARYLLLSDCSHAFVTIKTNITTRLQAYHLVFTPPHNNETDTAFSVQCQRFATTSSRQHLHNKFSLLLLTPRKKLLVGTTPFTVDFGTTVRRQFDLAALQVASTTHSMRFFVFPRNSLVSATDSQRSGHWLYLLPGNYVLEFNGVRTAVKLQRGEEKIIYPAILHISTPQPVPHVTARINDNRIVPFNQPLPLPATRINLRLMPNSQPQPLTLRSGQRTVITARHLQITPACNTQPCTRTFNLSLYHSNKDTPFLTTTARDIFFRGQAVRLSLASTPRLTRLLPDQRQTKLQLGILQLQPRIISSTTQFSDLLRLEAAALPLQGHSDDLSLTTATTLPLLPGRYHLAHFVSSTHTATLRHKRSTTFTLRPQEVRKMTVTVFRHKRVSSK